MATYEERLPMIAAAAERNKNPIREALKTILPDKPVLLLEISSGTGQHVTYFALDLPQVEWQPTEIDPSYIESISAMTKSFGLSQKIRPPVVGDVLKPVSEWAAEVSNKIGSYDFVFCSNLIHISPWACTVGLFSTANSLLKPGTGVLITYGPYAVNGVLSPESNVNFDKWLRSVDPAWGLKDVRDLATFGATQGFQFERSIDMPANNKILIFKKVA